MHFKEVCRHGKIISQCRCLSKDKPTKIGECAPNCPVGDYPVDTLIVGPTGNFTESISLHDAETLVMLGVLVLDSVLSVNNRNIRTYRKAG